MSKIFATNNLKILSNKLATITLILLLTVSAAFMTLSAVKAHDPGWSIKTYGFVTATSPVGIGQTIFMNMFVHMPAPTVSRFYGDMWEGLTLTITKPDDTTVVLGPFTADATGGTYTTYVADQLGEWTLKFDFPGQTLTGYGSNPARLNPRGTTSAEYVGDYFQPCSATTTVTVQQEQLETYPFYPPPTDYWQRPIYAMNSLWSSIGGNWLGLAQGTFHSTGVYNATGSFNPYTTAPNSPHIVWTRPLKLGGQIGGDIVPVGTELTQYTTTAQYMPQYAGIVIAGRLYYLERPGDASNPTGWNCVDIRTGELIWHKNTTDPLMCGQVLQYVSINQYGAYAYLWAMRPTVAPNTGRTYGMFDAWTGEWVLDVVNCPNMGSQGWPATMMLDTRGLPGSLLGYYVTTEGDQRYLNLWNSSFAILSQTVDSSGNLTPEAPYGTETFWSPAGIHSNGIVPPMTVADPPGSPGAYNRTIPWDNGIMWKKPIPMELNGNSIRLSISGSQSTPDVILMRYSSVGSPMQRGWFVDAGFSARDGTLLWGPFNRTDVVAPFTYTRSGVAGSGCYAYGCSEEFTWTGFSIDTGQKLWGPKVFPHNSWDKYGIRTESAYGNLYTISFGGIVNCIDYKTGELKWTFSTGSAGYDTPFGIWPIWTFTRTAVADGKIFCSEGSEYSPPMYRGAQGLVIDAFTGELVWSALGFYAMAPPIIADGYLVEPAAYDAQLYCYGKGKSATTVTTSPKVIPLGESALVEGTVTDQSPGQTCLGIPAAGTPAIADLYMKPWMEYMYMQQPMPQNATGVPVVVQAMDSAGNMIDLGTVTSDAFGNFKVAFCPDKEDVYTILASFLGSDSYYASYASTDVAFGPAPPEPEPYPEPEPAADYTPMFTAIIAAVIVVAILVVIDIVLARRK
jgi:hypothetical protein